jgi:hypothetical protein
VRSRPVWLVIAAVALIVLVAIGFSWWRDDVHYVGATRRVELGWECSNGIHFDGPAGTRWWAGHNPITSGTIETTDPAIHSHHEGTGTVHFDSAETATFTSDAGGTMPFVRERSGQLFTLDCNLRGL